jgi:hypothetical protein
MKNNAKGNGRSHYNDKGKYEKLLSGRALAAFRLLYVACRQAAKSAQHKDGVNAEHRSMPKEPGQRNPVINPAA